MKNQDSINNPVTSTSVRKKTTIPPYNYEQCFDILVNHGRKLYGPKFRIFEQDRATIRKLLCWFLQDDVAAAAEGINLTKGLLLTGPVGCGKSAIMRAFHTACDPACWFIMRSAQFVATNFAEEGYSVIDKHARRPSLSSPAPVTICFDDVGAEGNIPYYGVTVNIMAEILPRRYELFLDHKVFTHITTNLTSDELEERYGLRVRSRMSEMFNLVAFPKDSPDKRRL